MKTAIISDVHGNYSALIKVIEHATLNKVDRFIFIGDYVFDLPFSNEVVKYISLLKNADVVLGNKEVYLKALSQENQAAWVFDQMGAMYQTYRELSEEALAFISTLKEDAYIPLQSGGFIYASHYPKDMLQGIKADCTSSQFHKKMIERLFSHEQFLCDFSELLKQDEFKSLFGKIEAKVILFGHNHLQSYGYCGEKLIINPGSCGLPLDFDTRASYTMLEETESGLAVIEHRVEYDIEATIEQTKKSKVYACGRVWLELVFLAMRTGRDYFGLFFKIATELAISKGETSGFFTNETWKQAYTNFLDHVRWMQ